MIPQIKPIEFDASHGISRCRLADELLGDHRGFNNLWRLHPAEFPDIFLHGRRVFLPRWQQAYGRNYYFSGQSSQAKRIPQILAPYLKWAKKNIEQRINGLLLNWYDAQAGHYIGAHRDSTKGLVKDSSIVMVSLGGSRVMRFRPVQGSGFIDIEIANGDVIIMPLSTNNHYKHEVPSFKRYQDKRISITMRCFE